MLLPLLACAAPDPAHGTVDPTLRALPADVSVVARLEAAALRDAPGLDLLLASAGLDRAEIDRTIRELGPSAGVNTLDRVTLGCGPDGCVALVEGDLAGATPRAAHAPGLRLVPTANGMDGRTRAGENVVVRKLSPRKAVAGDRAAARAAWEVKRGERDGLRPADAEVPAGDAWIWVRDRDAAEADLTARAERHSPGCAPRTDTLLAQWPGLEAAEELVITATLRRDLAVLVRARTASPADAERLAATLLAPALSHGGGVTRDETIVTATGTWSPR